MIGMDRSADMPTESNGTAVVITGATSGIGLATALALASQGAGIIGLGRSTERCKAAEEAVHAVQPPGGQAVFHRADLSLQREVRCVVLEIRATLQAWRRPQLDVLINNAATVPFWQTLTPEGFDMQWALNHLAPFLLTMELLPLLAQAPRARVITVSSGSHYNTQLNWHDIQLRRHYNPLRAYNQTKLANVLFTFECNRRFAGTTHVRAFAADPGLVNTQIGLKSNSFLARWVWDIRRRGGVSPESAAEGLVFLATEPSIQDSPEIYWKNGKPKRPSVHALNPQSAKQLWELSAQMCGVSS
jgi:NAD(P)-dependent dehydrogenase (short-subunit alcohol dehydrogenase family)